MNEYVDKLKIYLAERTPDYGYRQIDSLLEMLYLFYTENNPIDSQDLRQLFSRLEQYTDQFSLEEQNEIWLILFDVCAQQEKLAFLEGLHIGFRLFRELATGLE